MKRYLTLLCFCALIQNAFAVGESAVITLEFPAGAENTGMGETGVSLSNTVYSVFWNPANVACLFDEYHVNHIYSKFHEALLPSFRLPDLYHDFTAFSTTLENVLPHIDLGHAYFRNYINMGNNTWADSNGVEIGSSNSNETVVSNTIALRVFDIFSIGASFKKYDSRLAPGIGGRDFPNDGIAKGNAFDLGIRLNKKFDIAGLGYINPAIGISALNLGNDSAKYVDTSSFKNPLPRKGIIGASCEINALEIIGYTYVYEIDYNLLSMPNERIKHSGHKLQITPFYSILRGTLTDTAGERYEKTSGYVLSFNYRKTVIMISKFIKLFDAINKTNNNSKFLQWDNSLNYRGFEFKPNIHIAKSHSTISGAKPRQVREGQTRDDWAIGIGVIAGFPNFARKTQNAIDAQKEEKTIDQREEIIVEQEDGEIVEE